MKHIIPRLQQHRPVRLVLMCGILILLGIHAAWAEDVVSVGVEAVAPSACPDGCSCLTENQAAARGYVPCSSNQGPCFQGTLGQSLYCYKSPSGPCVSGCNAPADLTATAPEGNSSGKPAFSETNGLSPQESCTSAGNGTCTMSGGNSTGKCQDDSGLFAPLIRFFRSLFSLK